MTFCCARLLVSDGVLISNLLRPPSERQKASRPPIMFRKDVQDLEGRRKTCYTATRRGEERTCPALMPAMMPERCLTSFGMAVTLNGIRCVQEHTTPDARRSAGRRYFSALN